MILYKYVSPSTLLKILDTYKLYCGPISGFNDPFEGQVFDKQTDFSDEDFIDEICRQVVEMDTQGEQAVLAQSEKFSPIKAFVALYHQKAFGDMTQSRFLELMREYLRSRELRKGPSEYSRIVHKRLAENVHVFCMTENRDSLLMWAHYAEHHKGAVIGFEVTDVESFLTEAQPVTYSTDFPENDNLVRLVRANLGRSIEIDNKQWMTTTLLTKSIDWSYEAEWRVLVRHELRDEKHLVKFPQEALREVILGCRCSTDTREKVIQTLTKSIQHIDIFDAEIDHRAFILHYNRVSI